MPRIRPLLFAIFFFLAIAKAGAPTFCKCTCFTNSTIIPLGPGHESPHPIPSEDGPATSSSSSSSSSTSSTSSHPPTSSPKRNGEAPLAARAASSSCAQCNRAFCLRYNLPICKGAQEEDVTTMCFQRDSRKDQVIVWGFILGTAGLLAWAAARRVLDRDGRPTGPSPLRAASSVGGAAGLPLSSAAPSGWFGFLRRRGSGGNAGGLRPRDDVARGVYSPIHGTEDSGRGNTPS